ncbi:hypothetical protein [Enterococcus sp. AZ109]|uniref:hypothetical protein n=1 Tax=Enterococcus sp. AZ109 TaxID=2774634 RepID=UPI003F224AED
MNKTKKKILSEKKQKALKKWWLFVVIGFAGYKVIDSFFSVTYLPLIVLFYFIGVYVYLGRAYDRP